MPSLYGSVEISKSDEYLHEIIGFIRVHKDGRCERLLGNNLVPAGIDSSTGVRSKDVVISPETNVLMVQNINKNSNEKNFNGLLLDKSLNPNEIIGIELKCVILIHPYFGGKDPIESELGKHKQLKAFTDQFWNLVNRSESGLDDPLFNPEKDPNLSGLGCSKIILLVAEKDSFRDKGLLYQDLMEKNGWVGKLEMMESKDEDHAFFLFDQICESTCRFYDTVSAFINQSVDD
ncbi:hypothetical protein R6Q57_008739 [Mikania cordata]